MTPEAPRHLGKKKLEDFRVLRIFQAHGKAHNTLVIRLCHFTPFHYPVLAVTPTRFISIVASQLSHVLAQLCPTVPDCGPDRWQHNRLSARADPHCTSQCFSNGAVVNGFVHCVGAIA